MEDASLLPQLPVMLDELRSVLLKSPNYALVRLGLTSMVIESGDFGINAERSRALASCKVGLAVGNSGSIVILACYPLPSRMPLGPGDFCGISASGIDELDHDAP